MTSAWTKMKHKFSIRRSSTELIPTAGSSGGGNGDSGASPIIKYGLPNFPAKLLAKHPVDLLVIERCSVSKAPRATYIYPWEDAVGGTEKNFQPKVVLESWDPSVNTWPHGPTEKGCITRWKARGYDSRIKLIQCTQVGGALSQLRLLVARVRLDVRTQWHWPDLSTDVSQRPMANLLTPPGLCKSKFIRRPQGLIMNASTDPMPSHPQALIRTDKGVRMLQTDEFSRGLGFTKSESELVTGGLARRTTSVFHWEYLSTALAGDPPIRVDGPSAPCVPVIDLLAPLTVDDTPPTFDFTWQPKDLSEGGEWYQDRISHLRHACAHFPNSTDLYNDGLERLRTHRSNYDKDGPNPSYLQLLWWEFPPEHWVELRDGFRMNFLTTPKTKLMPNSEMDVSGLEAAREFVDELVTLGVFREIDDGLRILANAPLFVVPKPGQPGQWRCIADMKKGGQNDCIGSDPCFLPRTGHILEEMYAGGYSAVVDLSKYFHNFPTHKDDRPYLGMIHPVTGVLLAYFGLPMGSSNSPATSGRAGNSFMRKLREDFRHVFSGVGNANCYWTKFQDLGYDPDRGYGFVLTNKHGLAVKLWGFVDDFLIHASSLELVTAALTIFLDFAVVCGFLAHPDKLIKPSQEVKYCGFLFNTVAQPCLKIPLSKRERALAICTFLIQAPRDREWSRLSLAIAVGVLESLAEATPKRYGHTVLRSFHNLMHPLGSGSGIGVYYTKTTLTDSVIEGLAWWQAFLTAGRGRFVRPSKAGVLSSLFGDGSGTGTGGTIRLPDSHRLQWSATWSVNVFRFTSNSKELNTLYHSLVIIRDTCDRQAIRRTTVFYFTDSMVVYFVASASSSKEPDLHASITKIRLLEIEMDIQVVVIHIPGFVMIDQGTDGLSRGIWMSPLHSFKREQDMLRAIFAPVSFHPSLMRLIQRDLPSMLISPNWFYYDWRTPWIETRCFHKTTVWCPPPELGRQVVTWLLNMWVEQSYTTSAVLILPRTCSSEYRGLSRFVHHVGTIYPSKTPLMNHPVLDIPFEVLYIAPHVRVLPLSSPSSRFSHPELVWHQRQAAEMRGLPPITIGNST